MNAGTLLDGIAHGDGINTHVLNDILNINNVKLESKLNEIPVYSEKFTFKAAFSKYITYKYASVNNIEPRAKNFIEYLITIDEIDVEIIKQNKFFIKEIYSFVNYIISNKSYYKLVWHIVRLMRILKNKKYMYTTIFSLCNFNDPANFAEYKLLIQQVICEIENQKDRDDIVNEINKKIL